MPHEALHELSTQSHPQEKGLSNQILQVTNLSLQTVHGDDSPVSRQQGYVI